MGAGHQGMFWRTVVVLVTALQGGTGCANAGLFGRGYWPAVQASPADDYLATRAQKKFAALSRVHVGQETQSSCTVASATMVINAILSGRGRKTVTQAQVLATDSSGRWARATAEGGPGLSLDEFALLMMQSLHAAGLHSLAVDVFHVPDVYDQTLQTLISALDKAEARPERYYVIANFRQAAYVGGGSPAGHMAPVGAYDAKRERVLVFDVDRRYFQPYWVPATVFLAGMHTPDDETGQMRGYLVIRLPD